jgi:uncharacterized membrane protein
MTAGNVLSGSIPTELGRLNVLTYLVLSKIDGNCVCYCCTAVCLTHIANLCCQCSTTQMTDANQLNGTVPTELGQLSNLTFLGFGKIDGNNVCYCCTMFMWHVVADTIMCFDDLNDRFKSI